jgi:hypothetical protein
VNELLKVHFWLISRAFFFYEHNAVFSVVKWLKPEDNNNAHVPAAIVLEFELISAIFKVILPRPLLLITEPG